MNKKLVLAMGCEHTNPDRLKKIIDSINHDRRLNIDIISTGTADYLLDKYRVMPNRDYRNLRYVMEEKFDGYSYLNQGGEFYSKRLSRLSPFLRLSPSRIWQIR